ncbi:MAG: sugar transferase [Pseudomonadota bacterium]
MDRNITFGGNASTDLLSETAPFVGAFSSAAEPVAPRTSDNPYSVSRPSAATDVASRVIDLVLGIAVLPIVVPMILIAAVALKIQDWRGPIFYSQIRYGLNGKPFKIWKLRSMVVGADKMKAEICERDGVANEPGFKMERDPRVTRIGRILRKTHIDEMPQILNVLNGEMAIVGPRPNSYPPEKYEPWQRLRLLVKPGITGVWQISAERAYEFDVRCEMDLEYIRNKHAFYDLRILFLTAVHFARGGSGV